MSTQIIFTKEDIEGYADRGPIDDAEWERFCVLFRVGFFSAHDRVRELMSDWVEEMRLEGDPLPWEFD
jgi:hypothetical protein